MSDIPSVSRTELTERRRQLRWQRRWRIFQTSWQLLAIGGLTAGLIWVVMLPDWMLRDPAQIEVEGNRFLSEDTIRTLLPIKYPQFLLTLQPKTLTQRLESQAPIAEATVSRHLFPPGLTVRIQERYPVAIVYSDPSASSAQPTPIALLDERGTLIPYESYIALNRARQLPTLKIVGMQEQYRSQWTSLYQQVSRSPVKVLEIDWREPGNLILHTELGRVYLGAYSNLFPTQLKTLDQMRQLTEKVSQSDIDHIDLRSPQTPLIRLVGAEPLVLPDDSITGEEPQPSYQEDL